MVNVTSLAQHILTLEPDRDAARLAFYHYLKNLCEPMEPVTPELMNRFFARALLHAHWQENKAALFEEALLAVAHYLDTYKESATFNGVLRPSDIQAIPVENVSNLQRLIVKWLEKQLTPLDQFRVVAEGDAHAVAIVLMADRSLRAAVFPSTVALQDGEIYPLCTDFGLIYGQELQLDPRHVFHLEVGPHMAARFRMGPDGCAGIFVRGYTFQKYGVMEGGGLQRYPTLYYPLKRLEQFFVNRKTDPMYLELVSLLEKALELLSEGHPEAVTFGTKALERGRLALERIFPDDKMTRLLIENLEKTLALQGRQNEASLHGDAPSGPNDPPCENHRLNDRQNPSPRPLEL